MHILILTDRDWSHPQAGGTGTHLSGVVGPWLKAGHAVTVIAGGYEGAQAIERSGNLTVYRTGSRTTVFPRTLLRKMVGRLPSADVTLEVINGICWLSPLWRRGPRVSLVHHVHKDMYVDEMGPKGRLAAFLLETFPLMVFYRRERFLVVSEATRDELAETHALPTSAIEVVYSGVDSRGFKPSAKTTHPTMIYLGRLKVYKRVELLLDVLDAVDGLSLDVVGDGDHGEHLREVVRSRGLSDRVRFHGFVSDQTKRQMLAQAWLAVTASNTEGWSLSTLEAAASGTPTVAFPVGGLKESIVHGETGIHAETLDQFIAAVKSLVVDEDQRIRLSVQARAWAATFSWDRAAQETLAILQDAVDSQRDRHSRRGTTAETHTDPATSPLAEPTPAALPDDH